VISLEGIPKLRLEGLKRITDETGILQHAKFSIIDRRRGYTTDDNARALIAALKYYHLRGDPEALNLAKIYLAFLLHMQKKDGNLHNTLGFDRQYEDEVGSEDSIGRTLWAAGYTIASIAPDSMKRLAKEIFDNSLPISRGFQSPRARSFILLGLTRYHRAFQGDRNILLEIKEFADSLVDQYRVEAEKDWHWFESYLTYSNPRIPQALFEAYKTMGARRYLTVARESLDFLIETQFQDGFFQPIGSEGWYPKRGTMARYDQQPIEASCIVEAAISAIDCTGEEGYRDAALRALGWYHGDNIQGLKMVDADSVVCFDGITREGLNQNQGAESTISYYLAYMGIEESFNNL
jgi:hypothetical protein